MKSRNVIIAVSAIVLIVCLGIVGQKFLNSKSENTQSTEETNATESLKNEQNIEEAQKNEEIEKVEVTVFKPNAQSFEESYTGKAKAADRIKLFTGNSGQISKIYASEGQKVEKNQVIAEISGIGGVKHASLVQLEAATQSLNASERAFAATEKAGDSARNIAEIQNNSAYNQALALADDLSALDNNVENLNFSIEKAEDNYAEFKAKSQTDINDVSDKINDLEKQKIYLLEERANLTNELNSMLNSGATDETTLALIELKKKTLSQVDAQVLTVSDGIDTTKKALNTAISTVETNENNLNTQLNQLITQRDNLLLTIESTQKKAGYDGDTYDSLGVLTANENYISTVARNEISQAQALAQLSSATAAFESARIQADTLKIKAPVSGVLDSLDIKEGQIVNPQIALGEISSNSIYELEVNVSSETADKFDKKIANAYIVIGNVPYELGFKSISNTEDSLTGKVKATFDLPRLGFRDNQDMKVIVKTSSRGDNSIYLPLDAVIIGSEEQYVYVVEAGKAKKQQIKTGKINGDFIEIIDGLEPSDNVIVKNAKNLNEGQLVDVK